MSTEEQQEDFYLELGDIIKINAPPAQIIIISLTVTANISPNNNPIISNLINVKNPITTNPTAKEE